MIFCYYLLYHDTAGTAVSYVLDNVQGNHCGHRQSKILAHPKIRGVTRSRVSKVGFNYKPHRQDR